jgi:hypothetical protein
MIFVPHRKQTYGPPPPVTGISLPFYLVEIKAIHLTGRGGPYISLFPVRYENNLHIKK